MLANLYYHLITFQLHIMHHFIHAPPPPPKKKKEKKKKKKKSGREMKNICQHSNSHIHPLPLLKSYFCSANIFFQLNFATSLQVGKYKLQET